MSEKVNYSDNVGWTLWNYSKRISAVKYEAREAQKFLDSHTKLDDWRVEELSALGDLTNQLQDCAKRADDTWGKLRDAVNESDADLIEQHEGIAVIRGGGNRPELRERIRAIYGPDTSDAESRDLAMRIEILKAKVSNVRAPDTAVRLVRPVDGI
jgi:hypothetical protein